jgi:IstB-like ATP binding protein
MSEELEQLLKNLKLRRMLEIYEEQLRAAEKQDVSYAEFLTRLLRAQWHYRQEKALEYRIRRANLPNAGRWKPFPSTASPASAANRSVPSPNWTSSPKQKTSFSLAQPRWARPGWLLAWC